MKGKDRSALQSASVKDLIKQLSDQRDTLAQMQVNRYTKQSHNLREGKNIRRRIAVIQTLIRQKELLHDK